MGENGTNAGTGKRKTREARPVWLLIPMPETKAYDVFKCKNTAEARKTLQEQGIDPTDKRLDGIIALRGDVLPLNVSSQVVIKFGKAGDEAADE